MSRRQACIAALAASIMLGAPCATAPGADCVPASPPPGAFIENEPNCGQPVDNYNGGCSSPTRAVQSVPRNCVIWGTLTDNLSSAFDTDTYEFDLPSPGGNVTVTASAGFAVYAAIDDLNCSTPLTRIGLSDGCTPAATTRLTLPPGKVRLMITSFPGSVPCGSPYLATVTSCTCPGDVTGDCCVDTADLVVLLNKFGRSNLVPFEAGDMNGDQTINTTDLTAMLLRFGCVGN